MEDVFLSGRAALRTQSVRNVVVSGLDAGYQKFLGLISRPDASVSRLEGTWVHPQAAHWLEKNKTYRSWMDSKESTILEVTGPPGSGKTRMSTDVLQSLVAQSPDTKTIVLSFGFYRWDVRRSSERSLISSLLRQLLTLRSGFFNRGKHTIDAISGMSAVSCKELWDLFRSLLAIPQHSPVFIIVNAVDQCQQLVTVKLADLVRTKRIKVPLKIFTTSSTPLGCPDDNLYYRLMTDCDDCKEAIRTVVNTRVDKLLKKRPVWRESRDVIISKLCTGNFTYLDTMMSLDALETNRIPSTREGLDQQLMSPLLGVDRVFSMMLHGLENNWRVKIALNWIYHSLRPMTANELAVAMVLSADLIPGSEAGVLTFDFLVEKVSWDLMRDMGDNFGSTVRVANDRVFLVHNQLRQSIVAHGDILIPDFHKEIARHCMMYLRICSAYGSESQLRHDRLKHTHVKIAAALLDYAQLYWPEHYLSENPDVGLDNEVLEFLRSGGQALESLSNACVRAYGWRTGLLNGPLLFATQFQMGRVVRKILQKNAQEDISQANDALSLAASTGNVEILKQLRNTATQASLLPAIRSAAEYGRTNAIQALTEMLTESEQDDLKSDSKADDLVLLAAANCQTEAIEVLLALGHGVEALDQQWDTALHLSAHFGDLPTLVSVHKHREAYFISAVETTNHDEWTPLHVACMQGSVDTFDFLLRAWPTDAAGKHDLEMGTGARTLLQLAAEHGHVEIVRTLAEADAKLSGMDISPIELAALNGHLDSVCYISDQLELQVKNDVVSSEQREAELRSALRNAIENGHSKVVEYLMTQKTSDSESEVYLDWAVDYGQLNILKMLVDAGIPIETDDGSYNSLLDRAIRDDKADMVRYLVNQGLTSQWDGTESSIHYAARRGHETCLREVLRDATEEQVLRKNDEANTALEVATESCELYTFKELIAWKDGRILGDSEGRPAKTIISVIESDGRAEDKANFVRFLLDNGWRTGPEDDSKLVPLCIAAKQGDKGIVQLLLERGAWPNDKDESDSTALHLAAEKGAVEIISLLRSFGADPNQARRGEETAVHIASKSWEDDTLGAILGLDKDPERSQRPPIKADLDLAAAGGWTALHYASATSNLTKMLLEVSPRPQVNVRLENSLVTPLMLAVQQRCSGVAYLLLEAGADPNLYGGTFHSPLQAAAVQGDLDLTTRLLVAGGDPNTKGGSFGSPLYAAVWYGHTGLVQLLLAEKDDIQVGQIPFRTPLDGSTNTVLHAAAQFGSPTMIELLLKAGANIELPDGCGRSALYCAAMGCPKAHGIKPIDNFNAILRQLPRDKRQPRLAEAIPAALKARAVEIFKAILENTAVDVNVPDRSGWTALDLAKCYSLANEVETLEKHGATTGTHKRNPTRLSPFDKGPNVNLSEDGLEAWIQVLEVFRFISYAQASVRADHCIPMDGGLFYFEVEVLECPANCAIAVGLLQESHNLDEMAGWQSGGIGYHSDDGNFYEDDDRRGSGPEYDIGDTVGVAYDPGQKMVRFTLNGNAVGNVVKDIAGQMYPAVSIQLSQFGQSGKLVRGKVRITMKGDDGDLSMFKFKPGPDTFVTASDDIVEE